MLESMWACVSVHVWVCVLACVLACVLRAFTVVCIYGGREGGMGAVFNVFNTVKHFVLHLCMKSAI